MYWYNPATRTSERVQAPSTDEQAVQLLAGTPDSAEFIGEYLELRHSGSPIEQALVLVGHEVRLREPEHQLILRDSGVASAQQRMSTNFAEFPFHARG
jgi:hypothetical protein